MAVKTSTKASKRHKNLPLLGRVRAALSGLRVAWQNERSFRTQLIAAAVVIVIAMFIELSTTDKALLATCIFAVPAAELGNTAIEYLCDLLHPEFHPDIGKVKDLAAALVFLISLCSVIVGSIIILPPVFQLVTKAYQ